MHNTTEPMAVGYDAIMSQLLDLNMQSRKRINPEDNGIPRFRYASDYCTIAVDAGRQNGKTDWILRHFDYDDIFVVTNMTMKQAITEINSFIPAARIFTAEQIVIDRRNRKHAPPFQRCFVDSAVDVFDQRIPRKYFYQWAVPDEDTADHTFFLMG